MIQALHERASGLQGAMSSLDGPSASGYFWLDITLGGIAVTVLYRPELGLGLYTPSDDIGMGEMPDEAYHDDVERCWARIVELLCPKGAP